MNTRKKIFCLAVLTMLCTLCLFSQEKNSASQAVTFGVQRSGKNGALRNDRSSQQRKMTIAEAENTLHRTVGTGQADAARVSNTRISSGSSNQVSPRQSTLPAPNKKQAVVTVTE